MLTLSEVLNDFRHYARLPEGAECDINSRNAAGETPLHYMAMLGDDAGIRLLSQNGAQIDPLDIDGNSPLYHAVLCIQKTAIAALIECGADPHLKNLAGIAPEDLANAENLAWIKSLLAAAARTGPK